MPELVLTLGCSQLELAFNREKFLYQKLGYCEALKAVNSFCTVMLRDLTLALINQTP